MPLVLMCGFPSIGKTKRACELKEYLLKHKPNVNVYIADDGILDRNVVYSDRKCEIVARSSLKAAAERLLTNTDVVILDSLNYVKGFRYELYCVAKYARTTHCVVHCDGSVNDALKFNNLKNPEDCYSIDILQSLVLRFEAPNPSARWDSPLFTIQVGDSLPCENIIAALFDKKVPKPNMSTQNPPLMSPSFVHEADQVLQKIGGAIIAAQKTCDVGETISLPNTNESFTLKEKITVGEMRRKRKEFMSYMRANPVSDVEQVSKTFLCFLNS